MDSKVFELDLHGRKLTHIEGLDKLKSLRVLDVSCNQIRRIEGLEYNKELCELKLYGNEIEVLEGLERLTELCNLLLQHNKIKAIGKSLKNLRKLRSLRLDHNQLKIITCNEVASCGGHLTQLDLSHNHLTSVHGVGTMGYLEELKLASNQLEQLPDLSHCRKLQELDISANPLSKQSLNQLSNIRLKILRIESIHLDDVCSLPKLKSLEELHAANNGLCSIRGLADHFPNLELLDVRHNSLESTEEVAASLCKLTTLSELLLEGNALCSTGHDYRSELKHRLPQLQLLDGVSLSVSAPVVGVAPLMRPMTPSSVGPSVRQIEHQLYQAGVHLETTYSGISATFDMIQAKSDQEDERVTSACGPATKSSTSSTGRPGTRSGSRARLEDALAFASEHFSDT